MQRLQPNDGGQKGEHVRAAQPTEKVNKGFKELPNERGVVTKIYDDGWTDERGIARANDMGPDIAWFKDPDGNVLSVLVTGD